MFVGVLLIARRLPLIRRISLSLLIPYLFLVAVATILSRAPSEDPQLALTPFASFKDALTDDFWNYEIRANILMFIPVGFLLSMVLGRTCGISLPIGLLCSFIIETVQYFTHRGVFETDDLFSNFMGVLIGFIIFLPTKYIMDSYCPSGIWATKE